MTFKTRLLGFAAALLALPAMADEAGIMIKDAYARSGAKSGAAFFVIENHTAAPDTLVGARSPAAPRVELHTHLEDSNGVMKMRPIEGGIEIPSGGAHALKRGGDHVMFMGLEAPFEQGGEITIVLTFENAGDVFVTLPVDNNRKASHSGHSGH